MGQDKDEISNLSVSIFRVAPLRSGSRFDLSVLINGSSPKHERSRTGGDSSLLRYLIVPEVAGCQSSRNSEGEHELGSG